MHKVHVVAGIALLGAIVAAAPRLLLPGLTVPSALVSSVRPAVAVALVLVGLAVLTYRRSWWPVAVALLLVGTVAGTFVVTSRMVPRVEASASATSGTGGLSILSFNVHAGQADVTTLRDVIVTARPDIVVLPEAGDRYRRQLADSIAGLNYRSWTTGGPDVAGIAVFTAPRLGDVTPLPLAEGAEYRWVRLSGGGLGDLTVVAVHTAAPLPGLGTSWRADLRTVDAWCRQAGGPVVLAGDFNATLDHDELRTSGCTDVAAAAGDGVYSTWPSYTPGWLGVQIDHVMVGGSRVAEASSQVLSLPGSDHRALLARVVIGGRPSVNPR